MKLKNIKTFEQHNNNNLKKFLINYKFINLEDGEESLEKITIQEETKEKAKNKFLLYWNYDVNDVIILNITEL